MPKRSKNIVSRSETPSNSKNVAVGNKKHTVAAIVSIVFVVATAASIFYFNSLVKDRNAKFISEQSTAQSAISEYIDEVLTASTGVANVFDANNDLIFIIRHNNSVSSEMDVSEDLYNDILEHLLDGYTLSKADIVGWSESHLFPMSVWESSEVTDYVHGSLGWKVVNYACDETKTMLSDDIKLVVAAYLDTTYTEQEMVYYCMSVCSFGGVKGAVLAADQWFNCELSNLSSAQEAYMVYAFENDSASWEDFKSSHKDIVGENTTAEEFGFGDLGGDPYWLLKSKVSEELISIVGDDLVSENFNVKLEINSALQVKLQETIDESLRESITLGADGRTVIDGTVGVVNPKTGFVVVLVGGRTANVESREFSLNCTSIIGNYKAAGDAILKDDSLTYATLMSVETATGESTYSPFGTLVAYDQLGLIGISPVVENKVTLDELLDFGTKLYQNSGVRYISQVQDSNGNIVYTASPGEDVSSNSPNPDIRSLLAGTYSGNTCQFAQDCDDGSVFGEFCSEYIFGSVIGTMTAGYTMEYEDLDLSATAALQLQKVVKSYYQRTPEDIDPNHSVESKVLNAQAENAEKVENDVNSWVEELRDLEINSIGTRTQFENLYTQYVSQLYGYTGLVSDELLSGLVSMIDQVRIDRTNELLNYVA